MLTAGTELNYNRCIMPDKNYLSMKERPIDIIFTGNYTPKRILRKHLDNMDDEYIDFYEGVLSYLIDNPSETIDAAAEMRYAGNSLILQTNSLSTACLI